MIRIRRIDQSSGWSIRRRLYCTVHNQRNQRATTHNVLDSMKSLPRSLSLNLTHFTSKTLCACSDDIFGDTTTELNTQIKLKYV